MQTIKEIIIKDTIEMDSLFSSQDVVLIVKNNLTADALEKEFWVKSNPQGSKHFSFAERRYFIVLDYSYCQDEGAYEYLVYPKTLPEIIQHEASSLRGMVRVPEKCLNGYTSASYCLNADKCEMCIGREDRTNPEISNDDATV